MEVKLQAGVFKATIQLPSDIFPVEDFIGVHDPLHVRVLLVHHEESFVFVSLELTSLRDYEIDRLKHIIKRITSVETDHIWVSVTHTFSAPHTRSREALKHANDDIIKKNNCLCDAIEAAVKLAAYEAVMNLQDVTCCGSLGSCHINVNRDMETKDGWWLGYNEDRYSDSALPVLCFKNTKGKPIAMLYSYDVQSSVMDGSYGSDGYRKISSDVTGASSTYIESVYQGAVAIYCLGAAGDQAPLFQALHTSFSTSGTAITVDLGEAAFLLVDSLGRRLGSQVVVALQRACEMQVKVLRVFKCSVQCRGQKRVINREDLYPTRNYIYTSTEDQEVRIEVCQIGDVAMVGMQPELGSYNAHKIREASPFTMTMLFTMINGGAKYMAESEAYDKMTYEAMNSSFAKGSGELITEATIQLLQKIYEETTT